MLREEFLTYAAELHTVGARMLRDSSAALLPCCDWTDAKRAIGLTRLLEKSETLLCDAVSLMSGLTHKNFLTKYTVVIEARMKLCGVELGAHVTSRQQVAAKSGEVAPGTRTDIYDGYIGLSGRAVKLCEELCLQMGEIISSVTAGERLLAVPLPAVNFLRRICSDYRAAVLTLLDGEGARLLRRNATYEAGKQALTLAAQANGAEGDLSADALAAKAASGLIPSLPAILFDILLRYENLDLAVGGETH